MQACTIAIQTANSLLDSSSTASLVRVAWFERGRYCPGLHAMQQVLASVLEPAMLLCRRDSTHDDTLEALESFFASCVTHRGDVAKIFAGLSEPMRACARRLSSPLVPCDAFVCTQDRSAAGTVLHDALPQQWQPLRKRPECKRSNLSSLASLARYCLRAYCAGLKGVVTSLFETRKLACWGRHSSLPAWERLATTMWVECTRCVLMFQPYVWAQ